MIQAIFLIGLCSILSILFLCLPSLLVTDKYQFFPPPHKGAWQYYLFWTLFRIFVGCLLILSFLDFSTALGSIRQIFGLSLLAIGIGSACYLSYIRLGRSNSYGEAAGLRTQGCYRWSRNPIYLVSFVGMLGWGISIGSLFIWILLGLWALLYILAPLVEEPWLERHYGQEYLSYKSRTPRFIGIVKK